MIVFLNSSMLPTSCTETVNYPTKEETWGQQTRSPPQAGRVPVQDWRAECTGLLRGRPRQTKHHPLYTSQRNRVDQAVADARRALRDLIAWQLGRELLNRPLLTQQLQSQLPAAAVPSVVMVLDCWQNSLTVNFRCLSHCGKMKNQTDQSNSSYDISV